MTAPISSSQPMSEHTPTPWTLRQRVHSVVLYGPGKIQVMSTSWHSSIRSSYPLKAESLANAAFVLEAVNSHVSLKARIEELEAALRPFAAFADPRNTIPPDTILTAGSPMARKQITMADCYAARTLLQSKGEK